MDVLAQKGGSVWDAIKRRIWVDAQSQAQCGIELSAGH